MLGVCDCDDGSDEAPNEHNGWAPVVDCAEDRKLQQARNLLHGRTVSHSKRQPDTKNKRTEKRKNNRFVPLKDKEIQPKAAGRISGRIQARAYSTAWWLGALFIVALLPMLCCLCAAPQCWDFWRKGYYLGRRFWLYVLQRCGCSKVQTTYTIAKDVRDMV